MKWLRKRACFVSMRPWVPIYIQSWSWLQYQSWGCRDRQISRLVDQPLWTMVSWQIPRLVNQPLQTMVSFWLTDTLSIDNKAKSNRGSRLIYCSPHMLSMEVSCCVFPCPLGDSLKRQKMSTAPLKIVNDYCDLGQMTGRILPLALGGSMGHCDCPIGDF